ncbi:MAG: CopG family transcriptional regulator [Acidimicrobiia bacterium]
MTPDEPPTPQQEYGFFLNPTNLEPQGPMVRRAGDLTATVPVRLSPAMLDEVRRRAAADHRSVLSWIRVTIDRELKRDAS